MSKPRIFQIGFNKCATRAFHNLFRLSGIKSVHWDNGRLAKSMYKNASCNVNLLNDYDDFEAFLDMEVVDKKNGAKYAHMDFFKQLFLQYPNSYFILNTRPHCKWIKSRLSHSNGYYLDIIKSFYKISEENIVRKWTDDWFKHHYDVVSFFNNYSKFIIFDIENDDPIRLIEFLKDDFFVNIKFWSHLEKHKNNKNLIVDNNTNFNKSEIDKFKKFKNDLNDAINDEMIMPINNLSYKKLKQNICKVLRNENVSVHQNKLSEFYLAKYNFKADVIIDIGVANGTNWLYRAFKTRKFLLIDPLVESFNSVKKFFSAYDMSFIECALASRAGQANINVTNGSVGRSSLCDRHDVTKKEGETYETRCVNVNTLDAILPDNTETLYGIKIDTEGFELEVLKGATNTLKNTEFIVLEMSIKDRFKDSYCSAELISFLYENGFTILDTLNGWSFSPKFIDTLFVKVDDQRLRQ